MIHHVFQRISRIFKSAPHHIGTHPNIIRRISSRPIFTVIFRFVLRIFSGTQKNIGIIINSVMIIVYPAFYRCNAEILRCVADFRYQPKMSQHRISNTGNYKNYNCRYDHFCFTGRLLLHSVHRLFVD